MPSSDRRLIGLPYVSSERAKIPFHIVDLPTSWSERIPAKSEWAEAVGWGREVLRNLKPSVVHLQFWQQWWWFGQSAIEEGIPLVYTACDYGTVCSRTVMVMGNDSLCNGESGVGKCSWCVLRGRNLVGLANEVAAVLPVARSLVQRAYDGGSGLLARRGGVRLPVFERTRLTLGRSQKILGGAARVIVTSPFAKRVFEGAGARPGRCEILPWFNDQVPQPRAVIPDGAFHLGIAARIAPDKGIHVLLDALKVVRSRVPVVLHVAGEAESAYGQDLRARFSGAVASNAEVRWEGWIPGSQMAAFLASVDAVAVPSLWYDNTPTAMVEALAHHKPVICTDVPSMTHLVHDGENGLVFPMGDSARLAACIARLADSPELYRRLSTAEVVVPSATQYAERLAAIYGAVTR